MKVSNAPALVGYLLSLSLLPTTYALIGIDWSVPGVPSTGLKDITFPLTSVGGAHKAGYYYAQQFNFVGTSDVGYTGLQPRPDNGGRTVLHGVFSSFIAGTTTADPNCSPGADGGPGVSCSVEWNGVYGRTYNFEVRNIVGTVWEGTVVDSVTGQRIHIGTYTLPRGTAGIRGRQVGFVEYYLWNSGTHTCESLPYQRSIFGNPYTTLGGSTGTLGSPYEYGNCVGKVAFQAQRVAGGEQISCGF